MPGATRYAQEILPPHSIISMRRHGAKNADHRGGVTCLYDTQLLGACLHASESGGRSRPEAVRGIPDVPIAPQPPGPILFGTEFAYFIKLMT